jgi:hypothetical protein
MGVGVDVAALVEVGVKIEKKDVTRTEINNKRIFQLA